MSEPGKYVLLKKVQPSSKIIKKAQKQKNRKLEKKLQKIQQKQDGSDISKRNGKNMRSNERISNKKKKAKQKQQKGILGVKLKEHPTKSPVAKELQFNAGFKAEKHKTNSGTPTTPATKTFGDDLSDRLKASRFRFINEQLYTQTGEQAIDVFKQDESAFSSYHDGYRKQIEQWPINPLDRIVKSIKKLPLNYVVADFGCGEARLAESISQKCYSFDLVASNNRVIACNMAHTPIPSDSMDVAVFCLSLMGTNLKDFLLEANRVLKIGGHLKVAEIESRFDNVHHFINNLKCCGFELLSKDITTKVFYFLYFKKLRNVSDSKQIRNFSLKPCLYKKR